MPERINVGTGVISEAKSAFSRFTFEKIIRPISLEIIESATLESARETDLKGGGFYEVACHYFSILKTYESAGTRLEALVNLSQQLINLGRFGQAKEYLEQMSLPFVENLTERDRNYYLARRSEKLGWIADYEGDFEQSLYQFAKAREILATIPENEKSEREKSLFSTTTHFLGRAHLGLVLKGEEVDVNVGKAINYFNEDLERAESFREQGNPIPDNEGFQHAWLARCYLAVGNNERAREEIEEAGRLWDEYLNTHPGRGIKAHYHLLRGGFLSKTGDFTNARREFEKSLKIRLTKEHYPKGEADALMRIAFTYWAERKVGQMFVYTLRAVKIHPPVIIRPPM